MNLFGSEMYGNVERVVMYDSDKGLKKVLKGSDKENCWIKRLNEVFDKFEKGKEKDLCSFKVLFRSFKVVGGDLYKERYKCMKGKELVVEYEDMEYGENVMC